MIPMTPRVHPFLNAPRATRQLIAGLLIALVLGVTGLCFTGCATRGGPERTLLEISDSVADTVQAAKVAWAQDYHRREQAHQAAPKDVAWFDTNRALLLEQAAVNQLWWQYRDAHDAAIQTWIAVKQAGQNPDQDAIQQRIDEAGQAFARAIRNFIKRE